MRTFEQMLERSHKFYRTQTVYILLRRRLPPSGGGGGTGGGRTRPQAAPPPPVRRSEPKAARRVGAPRPEAEPARARPQAGARDCAEPEEPSPPRGQGAHQAEGFLFLVKGDIMTSESCPKIGENPVFASLKPVDITSCHYNVRLKLYPSPNGEVRPVELLALSRPAYNPEGWELVGRDAPPPPLAAGEEGTGGRRGNPRSSSAAPPMSGAASGAAAPPSGTMYNATPSSTPS